MPEDKFERIFYMLGGVEKSIQNMSNKLDKSIETQEKHEVKIDEIKNWQSGVASKITLISAGAGFLFSFLFDWLKNKFKG